MTPDTSVVVAGFADWHPDFERAHKALLRLPALVSHVAIEAYSTLTRLPVPFRVSAEVAAQYIDEGFATPRLTLSPEEHDGLIAKLASSGVSGGAAYDALVALTSAHHRLTLATLDRRAEITYKRLGVPYELL
jgi:predicted nucleic acid-binding protein